MSDSAGSPVPAQGDMRPYGWAIDRLRRAGLRPTRQRLALARLLFAGTDRHVTAEGLHAEALSTGVRVSLATIYNSLHQFTEAGLLRQVVVDGARTYFDTNVGDHHHFFVEEEGKLLDIPGSGVTVCGLPEPPTGCAPTRVDVIVRVTRGK
jgi:Fur family transcriptional regulator, iron response regulator